MTEILVLGGGYTAVWAARRILRAHTATARRSRVPRVRVTVVAASPTHAFHGWTAEVLTGHVALERTLTPLTDLLPGAQVVQGTVLGVDLARRQVTAVTPDGVATLGYDQLVIGVGSEDASEGVPGLAEHGFTTKGEGQLARLRSHLDDLVERAAHATSAAERRRLLTVIVAGGGFAGVETAVAIRQRLEDRARREPLLARLAPSVFLVHSGPALLPSLRPRFGAVADHAVREVEASGVQICTTTRLTGVTPTHAVLATASREYRLPVGAVVTTIGQLPVTLPGLESLVRGEGGRLAVDDLLRVHDAAGPVPGVWAGGDVATVPHPGGGACPASALWAIHHGVRIGANVVRTLSGRAPRPFRFPGLGQAASFGVGRASAELYAVPLRGWPAWVARWALFHWYMPSRRVALATLREWLTPPRLGPRFGRAGAAALREAATPPRARAPRATPRGP